VEACDGVDNDCDDAVDEELAPRLADLQDGVCEGAQKRCGAEAGWLEPDYAARQGWESPELTCDGQDNDCDGAADEVDDLTAAGTVGAACGTNEGECVAGAVACVEAGLVCAGEVAAADMETCNDLDDDCDGVVDEAPIRVGREVQVSTSDGGATGPALAWNGNGLGVVWADNVGGVRRIWFQRVDRAAARMGEARPVPGTNDVRGAPSLAWDGAAHGLVWSRDIDEGLAELQLLRLDVDGDALTEPIPVTAGGVISQSPRLVAAGDGWGLGWDVQDGADWTGRLVLLDHEGAPRSAPVRLQAEGGQVWGTRIARSDELWAAAWTEDVEGTASIRLLLLDAWADRQVGPFLASGEGANAANPSLAWSGEGWSVGWQDWREGRPRIYHSLVGRLGERVGEDQPFSQAGQMAFSPAAAGSGTGVALAWRDQSAGVVSLAQPGAEGGPPATVVGLSRFGVADVSPPELVHAGGRFAAAWTDQRSGQREVYVALGRPFCEPCAPTNGGAETCDGTDNDCDGTTDVDEAGRPVGRACYSGEEQTRGVGLCEAGWQTCEAGDWGVCEGEILPAAETCQPGDQDCDGAVDEGPILSWGPAEVDLGFPGFEDGLCGDPKLAWRVEMAGLLVCVTESPRLRFGRLDLDGTLRGPLVEVADRITGGEDVYALVLGLAGFGLVWSKPVPGGDQVWFATVSTDGDLGDPVAVSEVVDGGTMLDIAWSGGEYGVVWQQVGAANETWFRRVSPAGAPMGVPTRVSGGEGTTSWRPAIAWDGFHFGVAYSDDRLGTWDIWFRRIAREGLVLEPETLLSQGQGSAGSPALATRLGGWYAVWHEQRGEVPTLYGRLLDRDGQLEGEPVRFTDEAGGSAQVPVVVRRSDGGPSVAYRLRPPASGSTRAYLVPLAADLAPLGDPAELGWGAGAAVGWARDTHLVAWRNGMDLWAVVGPVLCLE